MFSLTTRPDNPPPPPPSRLLAFGRENRWLLLTVFSLLWVGMIHRLRLYSTLLGLESPPLGFDPNGIGLLYLSRYLRDDLLVAVAFGLVWWLGRSLYFLVLRRLAEPGGALDRISTWVERLALCVVLFGASFLNIAHYKAVLEVSTGLEVDVLLAGFEDVEADFARAYLDGTTLAMLLLPPLLLPLLLWVSRIFPRGLLAGAGVTVLAVLGLSLQPEGFRPTECLRNGPIHYVLSGIRRYQAGNRYTEDRSLPESPQMQQLAPVEWDPALLATTPPPRIESPPDGVRPNVILLVLEGTGFDYVFRTELAGGPPAPLLRDLARRGWSFANHFSTANHSSRAVFSLLTGLYPAPQNTVYGIRRDIALPTLYDFVGETYDCFFTTPAKTTFAFPSHLLRKNPRVRVDDFYAIEEPDTDEAWIARSEHLAIDRFIERIQSAKAPFFGTYVSFIPHLTPEGDKTIHGYFTQLRYLDRQLQRVYDAADAAGLLENTVILVVGDHGEAFGQHPDNFGHSQQSFRENFHTPCILYGPKFFRPRIFTAPTSHVDLFPTLLDLMGAECNRRLIQGRSLLRAYDSPRQIFLYGREFTLTAIDEELQVVQLSYRSGEGWAYDLEVDRDQRHRLGIEGFRDAERAILRYRNFQCKVIPEYDAACRAGRPFHGQVHPYR